MLLIVTPGPVSMSLGKKTHASCIVFEKQLTGWWYTYPSEKYEFVGWYYYSHYMESHNPVMFQTTNQLFFVTPVSLIEK